MALHRTPRLQSASCLQYAGSNASGQVSSVYLHLPFISHSADADAEHLISVASTLLLHSSSHQTIPAINHPDLCLAITNALGLDKTLSLVLNINTRTNESTFPSQFIHSIAPIMYADSSVPVVSTHVIALCESSRVEACKEGVNEAAIVHPVLILKDIIALLLQSASSAYKLLFLKTACHALLGLTALLHQCSERMAGMAASIQVALVSISGLSQSKLASKHFMEVSRDNNHLRISLTRRS